MALGVNTNIASLNAQRNLTNSQTSLNTSLQRLSTGLRINSAKDDAAGLAISTRFTTQINGLNQAVRNANDGISLAQTGEAALSEITNNLQRIRELAVQSANATNSTSDRAAIDLEVQQRLSEISRIGEQTTFNGQRILDGSFGSAQFQIGANVGDTIAVSLSQGVKSNQIGQVASETGTQVTANAILAGTLSITVGDGAAITVGPSAAGGAAGQTSDSAYAKAEAINGAGISGLSAVANAATSGDLAFTSVTAAATTTDAYSLDINGVEIYDGLVAGATRAQVVQEINNKTSTHGVGAVETATGIILTAADGRDIEISEESEAAEGFTASVTTAKEGGTIAFTGDNVVGTPTVATFGGTLTVGASEQIIIAGATEAADLGLSTTIAVDTATISQANVLTVAGANNAIQRVDSALTDISNLRSTFGAVQQRFESITANLQTVSENLSASRSRILDADFAQETASLTRSQILQQAGISVLSQANAIPQNVLALLQ